MQIGKDRIALWPCEKSIFSIFSDVVEYFSGNFYARIPNIVISKGVCKQSKYRRFRKKIIGYYRKLNAQTDTGPTSKVETFPGKSFTKGCIRKSHFFKKIIENNPSTKREFRVDRELCSAKITIACTSFVLFAIHTAFTAHTSRRIGILSRSLK